MTTSSSVPGPFLPAWLRRLTGGSGASGTGARGDGEDAGDRHRRAGPVVAVGDGELADHVACWAEQLAHRTGRDLRLVVAVGARSPDDRPVSRGAAVLVRQRLDRVADDVAVRSGEVDVEAEVRIGRWADVVADEVRGAAVVVVPPGARPVRPSPVVRSAPAPPRRRPAPGGVPHRLTAADAGPGALPTA